MKDKVIVTVVLDCGGDGGAEGDLGGNGVREGPKAARMRPEDTIAGELKGVPVGEPQDLPHEEAGYATTIERLEPCKDKVEAILEQAPRGPYHRESTSG